MAWSDSVVSCVFLPVSVFVSSLADFSFLLSDFTSRLLLANFTELQSNESGSELLADIAGIQPDLTDIQPDIAIIRAAEGGETINNTQHETRTTTRTRHAPHAYGSRSLFSPCP